MAGKFGELRDAPLDYTNLSFRRTGWPGLERDDAAGESQALSKTPPDPHGAVRSFSPVLPAEMEGALSPAVGAGTTVSDRPWAQRSRLRGR